MTFRNAGTNSIETRSVVLDIDDPIDVVALMPDPQSFTGYLGGPFETPEALRTFEMTSGVAFELEYDVSSDQDWLEVASAEPLSGDLPAGQSRSFDVTWAARVRRCRWARMRRR